MFVAIDNKIPVNMTTDYPFLEDLLHPPTAIYKNTKKDFEDSVSKLCQTQSLVSVPVLLVYQQWNIPVWPDTLTIPKYKFYLTLKLYCASSFFIANRNFILS